MTNYLVKIWQSRYFWLALVKMDLRTRYRGSFLGLGWSLLQPIAMTLILCTVFHSILRIQIAEYAPFLLSGMTFWNFVVVSSLQGCQSFFQAESYIRQHPAPLAIYPLRTALGACVHFLIALLVVVLLAWRTVGLDHPLALLSLVPTLTIFLILGWSLAVLGGLANVYFQDTQHLAEIGFQILFYLTPIMYPPKVLQENHLAWVIAYNPLIWFLRLLRDPILQGAVPPPQVYALAAGTALAVFAAAALCLARFGRRVIFLL